MRKSTFLGSGGHMSGGYNSGSKKSFVPKPPAPAMRKMIPPAPPKPKMNPPTAKTLPDYSSKAPILERIIKPPPPSGGKPTTVKSNFVDSEHKSVQKKENK